MNSNEIAILIYKAFDICLVDHRTDDEIREKITPESEKYINKYLQVRKEEEILRKEQKYIALSQLNLLFEEKEIYNYHGQALES